MLWSTTQSYHPTCASFFHVRTFGRFWGRKFGKCLLGFKSLQIQSLQRIKLGKPGKGWGKDLLDKFQVSKSCYFALIHKHIPCIFETQVAVPWDEILDLRNYMFDVPLRQARDFQKQNVNLARAMAEVLFVVGVSCSRDSIVLWCVSCSWVLDVELIQTSWTFLLSFPIFGMFRVGLAVWLHQWKLISFCSSHERWSRALLTGFGLCCLFQALSSYLGSTR